MKYFLIAFLAVLSITSCKKDDDDDNKSAFIGTWSRIESIEIEEDFSIDVKDIFTFTKSSVTNLGQVYNPDTEEWLNLMGMKAAIDVSGEKMDVTVISVGLSDVDDDGIPTGVLIYFDDNDEEFEAVLAEVELEQYFEAEYSVSGDELTLKTDDNGDGDFNDDGETQVYTRE